MSDHLIYEDARVSIGLTTFPTTNGQAIAVLRQAKEDNDLFFRDANDFSGIMLTISKVAIALRYSCRVQRCALITEGRDCIAIIPLHGLSHEWRPIVDRGPDVFYEEYPGYISSKNGPRMSDLKLDEICTRAQITSGITKPFDYTFYGDQADSNLFAKLVRGELPQWRIWESDQHVAFLTPFANTTGFAVLVPRSHVSSDILSLNEAIYTRLVEAAHAVAQILKRAFDAKHVGMVFEGLEIDYAHVKLIPIRLSSEISGTSAVQQGDYHHIYPGYITSLQGPLERDATLLSELVRSIRKLLQKDRLEAPDYW